MRPEEISRREFLKIWFAGIVAAGVEGFPLQTAVAASCPSGPVKSAFFFFQKGGFLDIQFGKNPDIHQNKVLSATIDKLTLSPLKPGGFPYTGPNSSNWLFVFDLGCTPPGPLTLTLSNQDGKKITLTLELYKGTLYVGVLRGVEAKSLADLFQRWKGKILLTLSDGAGKALWQSAVMSAILPQSGEQGEVTGRPRTGQPSGSSATIDGDGPGPPPPRKPREERLNRDQSIVHYSW